MAAYWYSMRGEYELGIFIVQSGRSIGFGSLRSSLVFQCTVQRLLKMIIMSSVFCFCAELVSAGPNGNYLQNLKEKCNEPYGAMSAYFCI